MAGNRQHYIPQFLQKGFASRKEGEEIYTWVFRKKGEPFNPNIKNIGLETGFYSLEDNSIVDDIITKAESDYGNLINNLRIEAVGFVSSPLIPELIAHLEIRTRHFRENFLEMSDILIRKISRFITDEELFIKFAKKQVQNEDSYIFKELVDQLVQESNYSRENAAFLLKMYSADLSRIVDKIRPSLPRIAREMRDELSREKIKAEIKSAHIGTLKKTIAPKVKIDRYKDFEYQVVKTESDDLIQGDAPVLFKVAGNGDKNFKTFIDESDEVQSILVPLAPNKFLLGGNDIILENKSISKSIACNSLEYFITARKSTQMYQYQKLIGSSADLLTEDEIEELVFNLFN